MAPRCGLSSRILTEREKRQRGREAFMLAVEGITEEGRGNKGRKHIMLTVDGITEEGRGNKAESIFQVRAQSQTVFSVDSWLSEHASCPVRVQSQWSLLCTCEEQISSFPLSAASSPSSWASWPFNSRHLPGSSLSDSLVLIFRQPLFLQEGSGRDTIQCV